MPSKREVFALHINPLLDEIYRVCDEHDMSFMAFVHVPTDQHPTLTESIGGLCDDAPPTMWKIKELVDTREVIETHPTPSEAVRH